jgi:hypothetical protein
VIKESKKNSREGKFEVGGSIGKSIRMLRKTSRKIKK